MKKIGFGVLLSTVAAVSASAESFTSHAARNLSKTLSPRAEFPLVQVRANAGVGVVDITDSAKWSITGYVGPEYIAPITSELDSESAIFSFGGDFSYSMKEESKALKAFTAGGGYRQGFGEESEWGVRANLGYGLETDHHVIGGLAVFAGIPSQAFGFSGNGGLAFDGSYEAKTDGKFIPNLGLFGNVKYALPLDIESSVDFAGSLFGGTDVVKLFTGNENTATLPISFAGSVSYRMTPVITGGIEYNVVTENAIGNNDKVVHNFSVKLEFNLEV